MSTTRDYKSTPTCFHLVQKGLRFKLYNKLVHFAESEQAKKKVSSNFKSLMYPSDEFFEKLEATFDVGLSRIEFSNYLCSRNNMAQIVVATL